MFVEEEEKQVQQIETVEEEDKLKIEQDQEDMLYGEESH